MYIEPKESPLIVRALRRMRNFMENAQFLCMLLLASFLALAASIVWRCGSDFTCVYMSWTLPLIMLMWTLMGAMTERSMFRYFTSRPLITGIEGVSLVLLVLAILVQPWLHRYISYDIGDGLAIGLTLVGFSASVLISLYANFTDEAPALPREYYDE